MGDDKSFDERARLYADGKLGDVLSDREATELADRARELANEEDSGSGGDGKSASAPASKRAARPADK